MRLGRSLILGLQDAHIDALRAFAPLGRQVNVTVSTPAQIDLLLARVIVEIPSTPPRYPRRRRAGSRALPEPGQVREHRRVQASQPESRWRPTTRQWCSQRLRIWLPSLPSFDFQLLVREEGTAATVLAYDWEIRFPEAEQGQPRWVRFDLNPPGHNDTDGRRAHVHLGSDDDGMALPSPISSPFEAQDLLLHGIRRTGRIRRLDPVPVEA